MTNGKLKKKIVEILFPVLKGSRVSCNEENACERCWFPCEIERMANGLADALIEAGIGDTSDLEVKCEVLQRDVDNLTRTMEEGAEELKEAEHRAEVAERALKRFALVCSCNECPFRYACDEDLEARHVNNYAGCVQKYLETAEKELAEERKGEKK